MAATVTYSGKADSIVGTMEFVFSADGTATTLSLGFNPSEVCVINETDATIWFKIGAQAAANSIKQVTAGTTTLDTGSAILFNGDGTITLSSTLCASGKAIKGIARR